MRKAPDASNLVAYAQTKDAIEGYNWKKIVDKFEEENAIKPSKDGNVVIDVSEMSDYDEMYVDILQDRSYRLFGEILKFVRENREDEFSEDPYVVVDGEHEFFETIGLGELNSSHTGKVVKLEAQVQDAAEPHHRTIRTCWKCQKEHRTYEWHSRYEDTVESPDFCSHTWEEDGETKRCGCSPFAREEVEDVSIEVQQIVFSEIAKDDRNSRSLIGEVDTPLLEQVDKRDKIDVWAKVIEQKTDNAANKQYLHVLGVEQKNKGVDLTDERVEQLEDWVGDTEDPVEELAKSVKPGVVADKGHDEARKSILCSIVRGMSNETDDRKTIHTLLYGLPGSAKSKLMEFAEEISEISEFADASEASGPGLTASVERTDKLHSDSTEWMVTGGTLPQANGGIVCLDELDKTENRIQTRLNTPMAKEEVDISKSGAGNLPASVSVIATANPTNKSYEGEPPIKKLDVDRSVQSRFDLIIRVDDQIESSREDEIEKQKERLKRKRLGKDDVLDKMFVRDYLAYAKGMDPVLSETAEDYVLEKIVDLRMAVSDSSINGISVSGREMEQLLNLSAAMSKLRLGEKITVEDARKAWDLMKYSWESVTFKDVSFEDDGIEEIVKAAKIAQNPQQDMVMRQTLGVLKVASDGRDFIDKDVVMEGVDAPEDTVEWILTALDNDGSVDFDGDTVEVVDL